MCWRTSSKNENVSREQRRRRLTGSGFCPTPCPLPNGACAVGEGRKNKGALQAGHARLQSPTKKFPFPPRCAGGSIL